MLNEFFQKLFRQPSVQASRGEVQEPRRRPYEFMQTFSDETSQEYTILGLQRTSGILDEYHFFSREDNKEIVTQLAVEENGQQRELTFPGAIPESYFPQLLRQRVKLSIKESASYDRGVGFLSGCEWRCTQDHTLDVLTGELTGQKFKGHKYWLDDYPLVVVRVKNQPKQVTV
ncbi:MAG: hypothetical protein HYX20_01115 [Candidatus Yanofskybacteria bacterium]|nr:hypothetical protein [Candidatus Yanofskybacteria bacterium]